MSWFGGKDPTPEECAKENAIKRRITKEFSLALKSLEKEFINTEEPIHSGDTANAVCSALEAVFLHGLKGSFAKKMVNFLGGTPDQKAPSELNFWKFLTAFTHQDVISQLNHLGQITTEIGMCRSWIRIALNDGILESYLEAMINEQSTVKYWYRRTAFLRDPEQPGILKTYLQGLASFKFQLSYNSSVLNVWTITPLILVGIWTPPETPAPVVPEAIKRKSSQIKPTSTSKALTTENSQPPGGSPVQVHSKRRSRSRVDSTGSSSQTGEPSQSSEGKLPLSSSWDDIEIDGSTPQDKTGTINTNISQGGSAHQDGLQITNRDLDDIRRQGRRGPGSDVGSECSTADSHSSCPDPNGLRGSYRSEGSFLQAGSLPEAGGQGHMKQFVDELRRESVEERILRASEEVVKAKINEVRMSQDDEGQIFPSKPSEENFPKPTEPHLAQSPGGTTALEGSDLVAKQPVPIAANDQDETKPISIAAPFGHKRQKSGPLEPVITTAEAVTIDTYSHEEEDIVTLRGRLGTSIYESDTLRARADTIDFATETDQTEDQTPSSGLPKHHSVGNSLGKMTGWSTSFEDNYLNKDFIQDSAPCEGSGQVTTETDRMIGGSGEKVKDTGEEQSGIPIRKEIHSYQSVVGDYTPSGGHGMPGSSLNDVLENLNLGSQVLRESAIKGPSSCSSSTEPFPQDFEVLTKSGSFGEEGQRPKTQQLISVIGKLRTEKGLDHQNYQCKGCARPLGMFYGKARVCTYDACYYCYECHENEETTIPAKIVHSWDFRKHKVCKFNKDFLEQMEDEPLINMKESNPRIYEHINEMNDVKLLRMQLRYLKTYLFTCNQNIAEEFKRMVWPKEYLFDHIHLYSLNDLYQVQSGQLSQSLKKVVKWAAKHVYECRLCSQKGFICEICDNPKVIFPFEIDSTIRCHSCKVVFHKSCKTEGVPCPKCERKKMREMKLGINISNHDYAHFPDDL
ncbi:uncharacterized protein LOC106178352 isoform X1 [Lingula anatina]|uniref:Uncharacterized protein LOC106178352 isoform X1 n=1 Tax=Lingula anatina TaxID=7574 RepID=A0A1S3K3V7_LINAN|nr:uncharacterized protein LOC106178352 isoform X1 [Lingula anatina]|eukprot:XP_013416946.1 uncharacterized protein LOC106178352 isoform X1 [Lingula anatina]